MDPTEADVAAEMRSEIAFHRHADLHDVDLTHTTAVLVDRYTRWLSEVERLRARVAELEHAKGGG